MQNDECLRCGYNLTSIANAQPCPECGLLAERSRRLTDELHQSRPRWLKRLSRGVWLIVVALILPGPMMMAPEFLRQWIWDHESYLRAKGWWSTWWSSSHIESVLIPVGIYLPVICLTWGVLLLTSREGYALADREDRWMRRALRAALLTPWVVAAMLHLAWQLNWFEGKWSWVVPATATFGAMPLVILTALRLRNLAKRARSAHLAEHCVIVGVGTAFTLLYAFAVVFLDNHADQWWGSNWNTRGAASLIIMLAMSTLGALFVLWQLYLLVRFAIAFGRAGRQLRREWKKADRAEGAVITEARGIENN